MIFGLGALAALAGWWPLAWAGLVAGAEPEIPTTRVTGGVFAPASLPAGTNALYGFVGAPELGVGYRQGFGPVEFEARGLFNLFEVSVIGELGVKFAVLHQN